MVVFTSGSGLTRINTTAVFAQFTFSQNAYVNTIILVHCKSVCRCIDGTPMSGANCKSDGGLECASCNRGFKLSQDKTACDGRLLVRGDMVTRMLVCALVSLDCMWMCQGLMHACRTFSLPH